MQPLAAFILRESAAKYLLSASDIRRASGVIQALDTDSEHEKKNRSNTANALALAQKTQLCRRCTLALPPVEYSRSEKRDVSFFEGSLLAQR